ncbi:uncharacterized protein LOC117169484 isoform X2 [Belonocnema kinseyi]|uniref:uncharacterized protein LOC117169484 isoform X2 n=1 Tax=Belonocnema kinseyi TaxID=2817044 RepID=UPI00143CD91E|nr:uncharacterized protein LOC117169484 isoform X2 [Belonocnema kinseyi]
MKMLTGKRLQRLEKKKKKMAALLEITKLNDKDREAKALAIKQAEIKANMLNNHNKCNGMTSGQSPNRKRPCSGSLDNSSPETIKEKAVAKNAEEPDPLTNKKPRLSGEEYALLKEELRERRQRLKCIPRLRLKEVGENASLKSDGNNKDRIPIFLSDVQHLLLYSLIGNRSPYLPFRWCILDKNTRLTHTVVLVVEGLSLYHFMAYESMFPHITSNLEHQLEVVTPAAYGGSIVEELVAVPLTGTQSLKLIQQFGSLEAAMQSTGDLVKLLKAVFPMNPPLGADGKALSREMMSQLPPQDTFSRTQLLLSPWQLVEEQYPLPLHGVLANEYRDYVLTKDLYVEATAKSPMFGVDCEMCKTSSGSSELTRISVVDEKLNTVYNTFVKPENKITDYLTRYSGITEEKLRDVTTTLADVQQALRTLLPPDAILVGQSLHFDLHALKMMHPYIIDTGVIFNISGVRSRKTKLQTLSREFLSERIQEGKQGHDSIEDAAASLKLTQLKLKHSIEFGDAVLAGQRKIEEWKYEAELKKSKEEKLAEKAKIRNYGMSLFSHVTKDKKTAAIIGCDGVMNEYAQYLKTSSLSIMNDSEFDKDDQVRLVVSEGNKNAVNRASQIAMEHALTICHVRISEEQLKNEKVEKTFRAVNKWVHKLYQHTAVHGLVCVVFGGQSNAANGACFLNVKKNVDPLHNSVGRA